MNRKFPYRRIGALCLAALFVLLGCFPASAASFSGEATLASPRIAVYNVANGTFVYEKDASTRSAPGATVKIMTAILALEFFAENLDAPVTVTSGAVRGLSGSSVLGTGLRADETIPARDLLYALTMTGACDAANALAIAVSGNLSDFVKEMNRKALALGAADTLFLNPTGLDTTSARTTAADIAKIAAYAYRNPTFMEMCSTRVYTVGATNLHDEITIYTRNALLSAQYDTYDAAAEGINVGYTEKAGYTVVSAHSDGAYPYICVAMGAEKDADGNIGAYSDVTRLLNYAENTFLDRKLLDSAKILSELPVSGGEESHVLIVPASSVYAFLDKDIDLKTIQIVQELSADSLTAPVAKGTEVGTAHLFWDGKELASVPLVTKSAVRQSGIRHFWLSLGALCKKGAFWMALAAATLFCALVALLRIEKYKKGNP